MKQLFLWRIVVFTIGEIEFPRIEFPTLDCRGCVALYHSLIWMDEDEDDEDASGFGFWFVFRETIKIRNQTISRE